MEKHDELSEGSEAGSCTLSRIAIGDFVIGGGKYIKVMSRHGPGDIQWFKYILCVAFSSRSQLIHCRKTDVLSGCLYGFKRTLV